MFPYRAATVVHMPWTRTRSLLIAVLAVTVGLAGCLGDSDEPAPAKTPEIEPDNQVEPTETEAAKATIEEAKANREKVPEAHYHHHWGVPAMPSVTIFEGVVTLTTDECFDGDAQADTQTACVGLESHIGSVTFGLEDDGDQVPADARVAHNGGHADTVFTGSSHITATFDWDPTQLGTELLMFYKPANSPTFLPRDGGIPVNSVDKSAVIAVGPGMADQAHQYRVSRWEFKLVADDGPVENWPEQISIGTGDVDILMEAYNGGVASIDKPHPDFWAGGDVLEFGEVTGSFSVAQVHAENGEVAATQVLNGKDFEDISLPLRATVPTGTERMVITAIVTPSDQASEQMDWGLKWHGANTLEYSLAPEPEAGDAGARIYTIPIDGFLVDPPYEPESFFRFGFYPIAQGQAQTGTFSGDYSLTFTIYKEPDFTYYF